MTEVEFLERWRDAGECARSHLGRDASKTRVERRPHQPWDSRHALIQLDKPTLIYRVAVSSSEPVGAGVIRGLMKLNKDILSSIIIGNNF